ncbi:DUF7522 family protein [Halorussus marinus]|uniref:DUF7522 family protein n=1 Tax=Halorussus marinus TaxID=2505976 RepID=UPI00106E2871|nr:hypothetical protein [Halorussus marinus]
MDALAPTELTEALQTDVGDGLRTVAVGDLTDREYSIVYIRDNIDETYSEDMREEIFEEMVFEHISEARQTDLFPPLGSLEFTTRIFEDGINVVGWDEEVAVFVGLDPDPTLIPTTVEACRRAF